jgi:AraC family transcriptional regulator, regulatory protein of adaptative response / methylated-DNA-[protein]-cysteine methyltransferase
LPFISRWSVAGNAGDTAGMSLMPPAEIMYRAVADRDTSFEGVFFVAVRTTGVFCRPGCPARTPFAANVEFFASVGECLQAGYRPCRRCRPLQPRHDVPAWLPAALALAESRVERRLTAADLRSAGIDPVAAARYFKRRYGLTFQAFHRARRMGVGLREIRSGATLGAAADTTGYESESGFRSAFVSVFGAAPSRLGARGGTIAHAAWIPTPLGPMLAVAVEDGLALLEFVDRRGLPRELERLARRLGGVVIPGSNEHLVRVENWLAAYFSGEVADPDVPLHLDGSPFQRAVWDALRSIPPGTTRAYGELARELGRPEAVRAVARANGANQLALVVPCHRVVGADGSPTGYGGGLWRKRWLLEHEQRVSREWGRSGAVTAGPAVAGPQTRDRPADDRPADSATSSAGPLAASA